MQRPSTVNQLNVTHINVVNDQKVKKGQPSFTVFQKPYQLTYDSAIADVKTATQEYKLLQYILAQYHQFLPLSGLTD